MDYVLAILAGLILFISLINFVSIRTPRGSSVITEKISVIVPLRNESENIVELIQTLRNQKYLSDVEFLLLDDSSEDDTLTLLKQGCEGLENFRVLSGSPLPQGWIGKTWALQQLLQASRGQIIVSIDADVRLEPDAISCAVTLLKSCLLYTSPSPRDS